MGPSFWIQNGANGQNWTDDPRFTKALLYQLSYVGPKLWKDSETLQYQAFLQPLHTYQNRQPDASESRDLQRNEPFCANLVQIRKPPSRHLPCPRLSVKGGIKVLRDEFNIIDRRGDKLRCVFLLDLGAPGVA
jgi:hypothetical protein